MRLFDVVGYIQGDVPWEAAKKWVAEATRRDLVSLQAGLQQYKGSPLAGSGNARRAGELALEIEVRIQDLR